MVILPEQLQADSVSEMKKKKDSWIIVIKITLISLSLSTMVIRYLIFLFSWLPDILSVSILTENSKKLPQKEDGRFSTGPLNLLQAFAMEAV
jgi:hypothetical protein